MNVWLDDVRPAPSGWVWVKTPQETISLLSTGGVERMSLDHDLGEGQGAGYDVVLWLEEQVLLHGFALPDVVVHSANPVGKARMEQALNCLRRRQNERKIH